MGKLHNKTNWDKVYSIAENPIKGNVFLSGYRNRYGKKIIQIQHHISFTYRNVDT